MTLHGKTSFRIALCALFLFAGAPALQAAETQYPLTLKNCGRDVTFKQAPTRAVAVGQSSTEILYSLGLGDKVVGTAVWFGPVLKGFEEVNAKVKRLADNDPSFESVLAQKPDIVTADFQWHVGPNGIVAKPEQFEELGIPAYTSPSDCVGKDNSGGGDGVRTAAFTMDIVYQEIGELAAIFNVQDRGEKLIAELKGREDAARRKIGASGAKLSAAVWFSSTQIDADPYIAGKFGAPAYILSALGIRNVVDSQEEWPTIGWETIAKSGPSMIVAAKLDRRRYPADDIAVKRKFLESDPVTSLMPAVKDGHVFDMDAQSMSTSLRVIEGIETLAAAIAASDLNK
ncbi:ABC transporter substrate-binding protein [Ochrobactrum soli]|uniref:Cobalt ABC transporter, periplasmic substrate-binding component CbtJ n=1 Tax=Ochrobactrum soli TaxID=2448455 RepID=A0A2P9HGB1_9HYPH|nr:MULTISPECIES: ABC transporter substrate-binding protein [Brucella]MCI1001280.1 ABC transporter substrate-binding protein [Ochrobactrum sp. C6C9]RRD21781.1 ABC transporter substrate-binding protein [Brucellaceae bacterium VT-16-1752]WHT43287.1 ABC transporter substrate-binding protein [Ochrobactrum sp. SSR]RLL73959.1 ABC transporter substrate-binding protein [[Ochrobactrum] soli]WHS33186.1 ABC transporter substrate-binding protein [Brucella sp. NM4]